MTSWVEAGEPPVLVVAGWGETGLSPWQPLKKLHVQHEGNISTMMSAGRVALNRPSRGAPYPRWGGHGHPHEPSECLARFKLTTLYRVGLPCDTPWRGIPAWLWITSKTRPRIRKTKRKPGETQGQVIGAVILHHLKCTFDNSAAIRLPENGILKAYNTSPVLQPVLYFLCTSVFQTEKPCLHPS